MLLSPSSDNHFPLPGRHGSGNLPPVLSAEVPRKGEKPLRNTSCRKIRTRVKGGGEELKLQFSLPSVCFIVHGGTDQPFPNPITEEEEVEGKRSHVPPGSNRGRKNAFCVGTEHERWRNDTNSVFLMHMGTGRQFEWKRTSAWGSPPVSCALAALIPSISLASHSSVFLTKRRSGRGDLSSSPTFSSAGVTRMLRGLSSLLAVARDRSRLSALLAEILAPEEGK